MNSDYRKGIELKLVASGTPSDNSTLAEEDWICIQPRSMSHRRSAAVLMRCARRLNQLAGTADLQSSVAGVRADAIELARSIEYQHRALLVFTVSVLCDLRTQGWRVKADRSGVRIAAPVPNKSSIEERKAQIRATHLINRDHQLAMPATRAFIREMERRGPYKGAWHSIFSLLRDGRDLATKLEATARDASGNDRDVALQRLVDPYIQVVEPNSVCEFTGLRLADIWRYFRHTWATSYNSTPGRKIWFLIRDRAVRNHPVMGIGALGNAFVQLTERDRWIGWTPSDFVADLSARPTAAAASWVLRQLQRFISHVYIRDFVREGVLSKRDLTTPSIGVIDRLRSIEFQSRELHRIYPGREKHKVALGDPDTVDWAARAEMHLFRSKRAGALARLLEARLNLLDAGFKTPSRRALRAALARASSLGAIATILRYTKAEHVGVDMMDITICGAIPPYNAILGGKLVAMLMTSPEVAAAYNRRYRLSASVIASSIAGRPIRRQPSLVLLGTTSLFDVASSQYNRVRIPAGEVGGSASESVEYLKLGRTLGYGSYHFSRETIEALETVLSRRRRGRVVNSIFGEGVNPKMRKVRDALDEAGLPANLILRHGSSRIIYAVALAANFREMLMGRSSRPKYSLPVDSTEQIAGYWRRRWLSNRITRPDVIAEVARHTLVYPIRHGGRVVLPELADEIGPLFLSDGARHILIK